MGNFSKLTKTDNSKKQEAGPGKLQNPSAQLKDNRAENALQLKLSQLVNSRGGGDAIQRAEIDEEELQMKGMEEDELQMKGIEEEELQMKSIDEEELQMKSVDSSPAASTVQNSLQRVENNTGLPDQLKSGVENLSGYSLDDVNVHYNSDKPSQLQAHAYAQGTDIHVAPGQEKHLPHEAWHVVQQKQGRVQPTRQLKGKVNINDNAGLENEADVMGAKALQLKENDTVPRQSNASSQTVQRNEDTDMTDSRMNHLVQRVLAILRVLMAQGQNWEEIYGNKGKELGQKGVEKAKSTVLGSGEKKGPSLKEKIIKEALKRWWASLKTSEKAEVIGEGLSFVGKGKRFFSGLVESISGPSGEETDEGTKGENEETEEQKGWFDKMLSDVKLEDMQTFYETYRQYKKVTDKIDEFERDMEDLAKEVGSKVGGEVGKIKTEREFLSKFEEQQVPYKVARLEFAFLKESITDKSRYQEELDALSDALDTRLQGPSAMINNPGRFTDKEQMAKAIEACSIAYGNLKGVNILRNATTSGLSNIKNWFQTKKEEVLGKSSGEQKNTSDKQETLVSKITEVCNKSWYWHTSGIFASKPNGVTEVGKKLVGDKSAAEKLADIKVHLVKPEKDLLDTENEISSTDDQIGNLSGGLKKDLTVDKGLSETRSQKGTEKFVGKQVDNSSKLAELGTEKIRLELKKKGLKKKIKGENRKPLTQVFYNAIKDLQPDNVISLSKTIAIMDQIGGELDNQKHTKD